MSFRNVSHVREVDPISYIQGGSFRASILQTQNPSNFTIYKLITIETAQYEHGSTEQSTIYCMTSWRHVHIWVWHLATFCQVAQNAFYFHHTRQL